MKQFIISMGLALAVTLASGLAFAQSSGNFTASYNATQCAITASDGTLTGGIAATSLPDVTVKVSSGSGVALVVTPSLVTGLYTKNKLSSTTTTSTQSVGLRVKVTVDGVTTNVIPELGGDGVIYDERFMQVTAGFLSGLMTCSGNCLCTAVSIEFEENIVQVLFDCSKGDDELIGNGTIRCASCQQP